MTDDLRFERLSRDWLELGPVEAPPDVIQAAFVEIDTTPQERDLGVPWRFETMTRIFGLVAAAAALLVGAGLGGALLAGRGLGPDSTLPSATPNATAIAGPAALTLDQAYHSDRYGYTLRYPSTWALTPAERSWEPGTVTGWGDAGMDEVRGPDARFVSASQLLLEGQTTYDWYVWYCGNDKTYTGEPCSHYTSAWPEISIGDAQGYVTLDGPPAAGGTINPGGPIFDAVVVKDGVAYEFTLDGKVDRALFEQLLDAVTLP